MMEIPTGHTEKIPTERPAGTTGRLSARLCGAAVATICAGVFAAAAMMSPSRAGFGTHQQLGMPPCSFLVKTGYPCPTCGLTTSLSAGVRGKILQSLGAHPFGLILLVSAGIFGAIGAVQAFSSRSVIRRLGPWTTWAVIMAVGLLGGWAWNLLYGLITGRLPIH